MKKILSIDFSTGSKKGEGCGYAFRDADGVLFYGSIKPYTKGSTMHSRTDLIIEAIQDVVLKHELQEYDICIEKPILAGNSGKSIELAQWNGYFLGMVHSLTDGGIYNIPNSKWASFHLIKGRRPERKKESCRLVSELIGHETKDDNLADAVNQLLYCEAIDYTQFY